MSIAKGISSMLKGDVPEKKYFLCSIKTNTIDVALFYCINLIEN